MTYNFTMKHEPPHFGSLTTAENGVIQVRQEINLQDMVDDIAKRIQRDVDAAALDKAANTLERFDYVKVVRCMDCKWFNSDWHECRIDYWPRDVEPDEFCSWGLEA